MTIQWKIVQSERDGEMVRGLVADLDDGRSLYQMLGTDMSEASAKETMIAFLRQEGVDVD